MLMLFTTGAVFIFINFLALRQAATPEPLLGRMTSTMRWLTLLCRRARRAAGRLAGRARGAARRRWLCGCARAAGGWWRGGCR
jgi:hypothetical protein